MTIWIEAQLSPAIAAWITRIFEALEAKSVRSFGLRLAEDDAIFQAAKEVGVVVMSKDSVGARLSIHWTQRPRATSNGLWVM